MEEFYDDLPEGEALEEVQAPPAEWYARAAEVRAGLVNAVEDVLNDYEDLPEAEELDAAPPAKKGAGRQPTHRNVCYTINAKEGVELRLLDEVHPTWTNVRYNVYQREMGEHEHFQGYIEFTNSKTYEQIHSMEGMERAHLEARRGNAKQADHYCRKPVVGCACNICCEELRKPTYIEGPWEFGSMSHQGQRADLMEIQRELNKGKSLKRIAIEFFPEWVRFGKAFKDYKRIIAEPRNFKPTVIVVVGPSGVGKSRFAHRLAHYLSPTDEDYYIVPEKTTGFWCDDYDQNSVFFMDEADGHRFRPTFFNGLVDRYPFIVPSHGSAGSHMNAKHMIFCTNYLPKFWWKNRRDDQQWQTMRRIDMIIPFFPRIRPWVHSGHGAFGPEIQPNLPCNHCDKCEPCCLCGEMDLALDEIQDWELIGD